MAQTFHKRRRSSHKIQRWLSIVAFIILLSVGTAGLVLWRAKTTEILSVQTNSMLPLLRPGDAVVTKPADLSKLASGDIISYHSPLKQSLIITHRVVNIDTAKGLITTKGDNAPRADQPFDASLLIGRVNYRLAKLGYALNFLRSPTGLVTALYIPAIIVVWIELRNLGAYYAKPTYRLASYSR